MNFRNSRIFIFFMIITSHLFVNYGYSSGDIPPPWNPTNTGSNHTLLLPLSANPTINDLSIDSGDYIGVFFDSLGTLACGGFVMWQNSTTAIAAWGADNGNDGFASGEKFKFKIWDSSKGKDFLAIATFNGEDFSNYDSFAANGMSALEYLDAFPEQRIIFDAGWNFYTSNITPISPEWINIFGTIDMFIIVNKDFDNHILWPDQSKNETGISACETYKIKVSEETSVSLWGRQIYPEDTTFHLTTEIIPLPYIRSTSASLELLFENYISDIRIIKSEDGKLYWPEMNSYDMINFYPFKAYQIASYFELDYTFPKDEIIIATSTINPSGIPQFYILDINTGNNMSLGILNSAWDIELVNGDEIGVFSENGTLAGSGIYNSNNMGITIWGDDETTTEKEGLLPGEKFTLLLKHIEDGFEDSVIVSSWAEGDSIYSADKISIIEEIIIKQSEEERFYNFNIYQSYYNNSYQFEISVPEETAVQINVMGYDGRFLKNILTKVYPKGKYLEEVIINDMPSGIYFFSMKTSKKIITKKIPVFRMDK